MLTSIPTNEHLARLYYELGHIGVRTIGKREPWPYQPESNESLMALALDMSRFDPRLFEALVQYLVDGWRTFNPLTIRIQMQSMCTPQTVGVVGEFACQASRDPECRYLFAYLMQGWRAVPYQLFFHNLYAPGTQMMARAAEESVDEFLRWGFLSATRPVVDSRSRTTAGTYPQRARINMLHRYLERNGEIRISTYLDLVNQSISRQQALNDLKASPRLRAVGKGRNACWRKRP